MGVVRPWAKTSATRGPPLAIRRSVGLGEPCHTRILTQASKRKRKSTIGSLQMEAKVGSSSGHAGCSKMAVAPISVHVGRGKEQLRATDFQQRLVPSPVWSSAVLQQESIWYAEVLDHHCRLTARETTKPANTRSLMACAKSRKDSKSRFFQKVPPVDIKYDMETATPRLSIAS